MNPPPFRKSWLGVVTAGLLFAAGGLPALLLCGCSHSDRPKTVPVNGVVTFGGQPPKHPGALFFAPLEVAEGYPRRGGRALFETDGKFAATSFDEGDGLVPGTYRVRVESWKQPPSMQSPGVSYVPAGFEPADLVVPSDERSVRYDLNMPNVK